MSGRRTSVLPSFLDLRKELKPGLIRPELKTKSRKKNIAVNANIDAEKDPLIRKKPHLRPKKPINNAEEA